MNGTTTDIRERFRAKLAEIFQMDQADLDFGIYRIMNIKREEVTEFLENDMLPQVTEALEASKGGLRFRTFSTLPVRFTPQAPSIARRRYPNKRGC